MAEYNTVMKALRNAHASGNTEHAKRLAGIASQMRGGFSPEDSPTTMLSQQREGYKQYNEPFDVEPSQAPERHSGAMPFVNRAIAQTLGGPVDLLTGAINALPGMDESNKITDPVLGGKSIERGMQSVGINLPPEGQGPKTIPEHMGAVVGQVSALLNPVAATTSRVAKGVNLTGRIASSVWESMVRHPYLTMTSELTGALGSGAARGVAENELPDSPLAKSIVETSAGVVSSMAPVVAVNAPTLLGIRAGKNILRRLVTPFTKKGSEYRGGKYLKGRTSNPSVAAESVSAETVGNLPPAIASGEKRIIELYKGLVGLDPVADAKLTERMTRSIIELEGEMRKLGYGSPELLEEMVEKRIASIELGMEKRILDAATKAQNKIDALPVAQRKASESRIVVKELKDAMYESRGEVNKLWADVDKNVKTEFNNTRETYQALADDLGQAQKVDIPATLKSNAIINDEKLEFTSVREMQSLRSKLLETSRKARKDGDWNKARIADDVADAILSDLDEVDATDLRAALAATRQFKLRFESGETGRLLGYSKSGAPKINPDLALEMTIGRGGEKGAIDIDKIVASPEAKRATERYLGRSFTDYAAPQGELNPTKAKAWMKTNEAILDEYPDLKNQLSDAASAQKFADYTRQRMTARKEALRDPKISASARFLNRADLGNEISGILKSRHPSKEAHQLVLQAKKDTSGQALEGLRAGFVEDMLKAAKKGPFNEFGEETLSGRTILNYIKINEPTLRVVFDSNQIARMKQVGSSLSKIETFQKATGKPKIELDDWASKVTQTFGRLLGAEVGGRLGGGSSPGGSLVHAKIGSENVSKLMRYFSLDKAEQLVQDAILSENPELLRSLLMPISKPKISKQDLFILNKNLNLWLASSGKRVLDEVTRESDR